MPEAGGRQPNMLLVPRACAGSRVVSRLLSCGHTVHAVCLPSELQERERTVHLQVGRCMCI